MKRLHTHYDNLKVTRNAPQEVIRAAYKSLSQKYHPDRNPGNDDASRIMALINTSYDVLSDPVKRQQHDEWILQQEDAAPASHTETETETEPNPNSSGSQPSIFLVIFSVIMIFFALKSIVTVLTGDTGNNSYDPSTANNVPHTPEQPAESATQVVEPVEYRAVGYSKDPEIWKMLGKTMPGQYVRPTTAPNGEQWPRRASYVNGYKKLHTTGLSSVTVDNTSNNSDVFVKLVSLDGAKTLPVREVFIPAGSQFTVNKITAGNYDVRYRDLDSGAVAKSEAFLLQEIPTQDGTQYSNITMTLYKVAHGNMQTYSISENEF